MGNQIIPTVPSREPAQRIVLGGVIEMRTPMDNLPINEPMERRAISLRFAIETKSRDVNFRDDDYLASVDQVIVAAKKYEEYISGDTDVDA